MEYTDKELMDISRTHSKGPGMFKIMLTKGMIDAEQFQRLMGEYNALEASNMILAPTPGELEEMNSDSARNTRDSIAFYAANPNLNAETFERDPMPEEVEVVDLQSLYDENEKDYSGLISMEAEADLARQYEEFTDVDLFRMKKSGDVSPVIVDSVMSFRNRYGGDGPAINPYIANLRRELDNQNREDSIAATDPMPE